MLPLPEDFKRDICQCFNVVLWKVMLSPLEIVSYIKWHLYRKHCILSWCKNSSFSWNRLLRSVESRISLDWWIAFNHFSFLLLWLSWFHFLESFGFLLACAHLVQYENNILLPYHQLLKDASSLTRQKSRIMSISQIIGAKTELFSAFVKVFQRDCHVARAP